MPESHATKSASKIFKTGSTLFFCFFSVSVTNFCWNRNEIYRKKHAETEQKRVTVAHCPPPHGAPCCRPPLRGLVVATRYERRTQQSDLRSHFGASHRVFAEIKKAFPTDIRGKMVYPILLFGCLAPSMFQPRGNRKKEQTRAQTPVLAAVINVDASPCPLARRV